MTLDMQKIPQVSAIITTHNRLELLKRAVKSVYEQTYSNIELIVVDDGSTDGTRDWCEKQEFDYIYIEPGKGMGGNYARNLGIIRAKGKYVAFLDDDDLWISDKISKQVLLIESEKCELVHCGRILEVIEPMGVRYIRTFPSQAYSGDLSKRILWNICATTSTLLINRQALIDVGLFDENLNFWQEYELTIRLAQRSHFYFVNEPLIIYRVDPKDKNRLTNKFYGWLNAVKYIRVKHKDMYDNLGLMDRLRTYYLKWDDARERAMISGLRLRYTYYKSCCILVHICSLIKKLI